MDKIPWPSTTSSPKWPNRTRAPTLQKRTNVKLIQTNRPSIQCSSGRSHLGKRNPQKRFMKQTKTHAHTPNPDPKQYKRQFPSQLDKPGLSLEYSLNGTSLQVRNQTKRFYAQNLPHASSAEECCTKFFMILRSVDPKERAQPDTTGARLESLALQRLSLP